MTRTANARIAGFAYLFYIAVGLASLTLFGRATSGTDMAAKVASLSQHATELRISALLTLFATISALTLAVTLYAITRDQDQDIAMMGLTCRVAEGVIGAAWIPATLALRSLVGTADPAATQAIAAFVVKQDALVSATFFAVGSTLFSSLLLRGRMIPRWLAWTGVLGSALLVIALPLQLATGLRGPITQLVWVPVALFELILGPWFMIKGVATPAAQ